MTYSANDVILRDVPVAIARDVWLGIPGSVDISRPGDDKPPHGRRKPVRIEVTRPRPKVLAQSLMNDLVGRYGVTEGRRIYWAMSDERKGPFARGKKYDARRRN